MKCKDSSPTQVDYRTRVLRASLSGFRRTEVLTREFCGRRQSVKRFSGQSGGKEDLGKPRPKLGAASAFRASPVDTLNTSERVELAVRARRVWSGVFVVGGRHRSMDRRRR